MLQVMITGADGFIGRNTVVRLSELGHTVIPITRSSTADDWQAGVETADAVIHLAGANRPVDVAEFETVNVGVATHLARLLETLERPIPILVASTTKAGEATDYGRSKQAGEEAFTRLASSANYPVYLFRLPNVFGKWARPNYNSAVATFCYNVARDLPITINDTNAPISLVYIDDVVAKFIEVLSGGVEPGEVALEPVYHAMVGDIAETIKGFRTDRTNNFIDDVGTGLTRALYATYVSSLPISEFSYPIVSHRDERGAFSEVLKTGAAGQFSYFTALPGVTRGGHYHHTKTEKFLIVVGKARFGFRNIVTGETHQIYTNGDEPIIVETVPGWAHDVTNVGDDMLVSLLWANEVFDRAKPDTISAEVLA